LKRPHDISIWLKFCPDSQKIHRICFRTSPGVDLPDTQFV
jgi:hypothetical protein